MNLINGGKHVPQSLSNSLGASDKSLAFQEYLVVPNTENVSEAGEIGIVIDNALKEIILKDLGGDNLTLGDEGGWAPKINDIKKPLLYLREAVKQNNLEDKVRLALDVASSSFYSNGTYKINDKNVSKEELFGIYNSIIQEFDLLSVEDPFNEEDFDDFRKLKEDNINLIVVGDDLTVTNKILLQKAIDDKSINAMIIKPNQIGTVGEAILAVQETYDAGWKVIASHRSGETDDTFIADFAYGIGAHGIKAGGLGQKQRVEKYERLLAIEQEAGVL